LRTRNTSSAGSYWVGTQTPAAAKAQVPAKLSIAVFFVESPTSVKLSTAVVTDKTGVVPGKASPGSGRGAVADS